MSFQNIACAIAMLTATSAFGCERLTPHFSLCAEGTPWADGRWENAGDSATLYVGEIGFEGYEDYPETGSGKSLEAELAQSTARWSDSATTTVQFHLGDHLRTPALNIYRNIATVTFETYKPNLWVTMVASGGGHRIMLTVQAPVDTGLDQIDALSRQYAGLIQPAQPGDN